MSELNDVSSKIKYSASTRFTQQIDFTFSLISKKVPHTQTTINQRTISGFVSFLFSSFFRTIYDYFIIIYKMMWSIQPICDLISIFSALFAYQKIHRLCRETIENTKHGAISRSWPYYFFASNDSTSNWNHWLNKKQSCCSSCIGIFSRGAQTQYFVVNFGLIWISAIPNLSYTVQCDKIV